MIVTCDDCGRECRQGGRDSVTWQCPVCDIEAASLVTLKKQNAALEAALQAVAGNIANARIDMATGTKKQADQTLKNALAIIDVTLKGATNE